MKRDFIPGNSRSTQKYLRRLKRWKSRFGKIAEISNITWCNLYFSIMSEKFYYIRYKTLNRAFHHYFINISSSNKNFHRFLSHQMIYSSLTKNWRQKVWDWVIWSWVLSLKLILSSHTLTSVELELESNINSDSLELKTNSCIFISSNMG